jgi:hypothetical protein
MAGTRHLGQKSVSFAVPALAAGSAADTGAGWVYNAFANGAATATSTAGLDPQTEYVLEASVLPQAAHTGQATNFTNVLLTHTGSTGTVKNKLTVAFSAAGNTMTAKQPFNMAVAASGVATGAGTATVAVTTGTALPWALAPGDTVSIERTSTGTGNASPGLAATIVYGVKS